MTLKNTKSYKKVYKGKKMSDKTVETIKKIMIDNNLSRQEFANKIGAAAGTVKKWEKGRTPSFDNIKRIENVFGINVMTGHIVKPVKKVIDMRKYTADIKTAYSSKPSVVQNPTGSDKPDCSPKPSFVEQKKTDADTLNIEQFKIFNELVAGENIFLTGNAGTGKSYLVNAFSDYCDDNGINLVKTAPTGVAAYEIGGSTLHSQFKLGLGILIEKPKWKSIYNFLLNTDVLLIDEISMVRLDTFDYLAQILILANNKRNEENKKNIQLVFVGDFYQLAPVINKKADEDVIFADHYGCNIGDGYAFQSKYWKLFKVKLRCLTQIMRQDDKDFCNALDKCKTGDNTCLQYFMTHTSANENEGIWVCGKNDTARKKNEEELEKINNELLVSEAEYSGDVSKADGLAEDKFVYKVGARVVITCNDSAGEYNNGSLGIITNVNGLSGGLFTSIITVKLDNGHTVMIDKKESDKYKYEVIEEDKEVEVINEDGTVTKKTVKEKKLKKKKTGSVTQFPLKLGYAVTIHKSQGQTYDAMNLKPEIFANGQLYVALSRCKSAAGIYIEGYLSKRMVMASSEVITYYNNPENYSFFDKGEEKIEIIIPLKYKEKIEQLIKEWDKTDKNIPDKNIQTIKQQWNFA